MFWKTIRWGGTAIVAVLLLAAVLLKSHPDEAATPAQPVETETQPTKNFNL
jgi:hypothetical protein